jgi:hypothetical protein
MLMVTIERGNQMSIVCDLKIKRYLFDEVMPNYSRGNEPESWHYLTEEQQKDIKQIWLEENLNDCFGDIMAYYFESDSHIGSHYLICSYIASGNYKSVGGIVVDAAKEYFDRIKFIDEVNDLIYECLQPVD